jgi:hypothetical protein
MLELLTGKAPVDLPHWVRSVIFQEAREGWAADVFDLELQRQWQKDGEKERMMRLLWLALDCCNHDANSRHTMSDIVQRIEEVR